MATFLSAGPGEAQDFDYHRFESLFDEQVTVSATGKPERISDSPMLMEVISADDIEHSGARDIPTLLHRLAGVDITHSSPGTADVALGGYIEPLTSRVMVLVNGRQVYFDGFGAVFWSSLPVELDEIRQIEVIRGPQSALYGFNAVDGVINIVTFDPVDDQVNSARMRVGNHARRDASATTTQALGDGSGVRLTVASDHAHDFGMAVNTPADRDFAKNPNRRQASFDAGFALADGSHLSLEGSHVDVTERHILYNTFIDMRMVTDSIKGSYVRDTALGRLNATAYLTAIDMPWAQTQTFGAMKLTDRMAVGQVSDLFKIGPADSFRIGGEVRHDSMTAGNLTSGTLTGDLSAGSAMWEHTFSPAVSTVNAVRYDHFQLARSGQPAAGDIYTNAEFDRAIGGVSVNSALIDKLTASDTLRLEFARGLKLPSLTNFGLIERYPLQGTTVYFLGNPDLQPSAVYNYQTAWDHQWHDLDALSRISLFHEMTMHHVGTSYSLTGDQATQITQMSTGSVANGIELSLQHKERKGIRWSGNYTFERLHEHYDLGMRNEQPVHKLNGTFGYAWDDWEVDLSASYASATKEYVFDRTTLTSTDQWVKGAWQLAPRLGWRASDSLSFELSAENLWAYRDAGPQKMAASYFLSMKISY
ncbi:TonB-dependent receptor plug domain-containing protein [Telmatospirillum sp.]|uniref:TonB-dependent receptor plug domain-containing protein n=1 Tax=Telmatospirillum sp. TaxID=2079197 RepID=UPI00284D0F0F|nr:TonB-dependent receptor plug domain-containing protein [Telmatospirillum sp.]MDR3437586.1 TonB-dependent receptor [Telmatospirillum sp.]